MMLSPIQMSPENCLGYGRVPYLKQTGLCQHLFVPCDHGKHYLAGRPLGPDCHSN